MPALAGGTIKGAVISMSAEQSQLFDRDYIRLTERFKALSTFGQFLQGIQRAFLPVGGGLSLDLSSLYDEVKALSTRLDEKPPERVKEMIQALDAKMDAAALELRTKELTLSPSLTRRYFEKVRPGDDRIPFYLLRFYLSQSEVDESMLDKVDCLATVAAAGSPDPAAPGTRSREEIRALFDRLLAGAATPIDDEVAPEIARAFDELASQIEATTEFADLAGEGSIEALRTLKRRAARGLAHPEILTAVVCCNLKARAVFQRLYEKEESTLREASNRITELESRAGAMELEAEAVLRRFRESRSAVDSQAAEGTVRWRQLLDLQQAAFAALKVLGEGEPKPREAIADRNRPIVGEEDPFWGPCLRRVLGAVEASQGEDSKSPAAFDLETWEREAALRWIAGAPLSRSENAVLSAAALRAKAESETEAARGRRGSQVPPDLLAEARATLSHANEIDRTFGELVGAQSAFAGGGDDVRHWMRTRLRLLQAASALWLELDRRNQGKVES
jgi:hypothetical protein